MVTAIAAAAFAAPAAAAALPVCSPLDTAPSPPQFASLDGPVQALIAFGGELVVGGSFSSAGATPTGPLARWTGAGWAALGAPFDGPVQALTILQGSLVAGGTFAHAGNVAAANLARWNGVAWEPLGAGTNGPVTALAVQAGVVLFAGGLFDQAGGVEAHGVARFVAGTWSAVGNGVDGAVYALAVYNGALVAAGDFGTRDSGGLDLHLARFAGGAWRTLALGVDAPVFALTVYQGSLVAGGAFTAIDLVTPARGIARLTGDTWNELGVGMTTGGGAAEIRALWVAGDDLVAGGAFESAGLERVNNIARWDGGVWRGLESGTDGPVAAIAEDRGGLIAGGSFAHASGTAAGRIAAFHGGRWATLDPTPVVLRDAAITRDGDGIHLHWALDPGAVTSIQGVWVERAAAANARGIRITARPLAAAMRMSVVDVTPDAAAPWYRIVLVDAGGAESFAAALQAPDRNRHASFVGRAAGSGDGAIEVSYSIGAAGPARLEVHDIRGRLLAVLAGGPHAVGAYRAVWSPRDGAGPALARGVYFASLQATDRTAVRKFAVMRP